MQENGEKSFFGNWKENKVLSLCVLVGCISTIIFFVIFNEVLWMGLVCFFIGVIGLYRKKRC